MGYQSLKVLIVGFTALVLTLNPLPPLQREAQAASPRDFTKPYSGVMPVSGNLPVLVILLDAKDNPNKFSRNDIHKKFFGPAQSVSTYFNEISHGRFNIREAYVTPWLVAQDNPSTKAGRHMNKPRPNG